MVITPKKLVLPVDTEERELLFFWFPCSLLLRLVPSFARSFLLYCLFFVFNRDSFNDDRETGGERTDETRRARGIN